MSRFVLRKDRRLGPADFPPLLIERDGQQLSRTHGDEVSGRRELGIVYVPAMSLSSCLSSRTR